MRSKTVRTILVKVPSESPVRRKCKNQRMFRVLFRVTV